MGNSDLSGDPGAEPRRGLVIFPAHLPGPPRTGGRAGEWLLVLAAVVIAAVVIAVALAVR